MVLDDKIILKGDKAGFGAAEKRSKRNMGYERWSTSRYASLRYALEVTYNNEKLKITTKAFLSID
ncbi:MAG: hypothetical protein JWO09_1181 [Bacteroidetes bacterium]|nr:hypothetical protein [Bacteroidota bacterium]